jgi:hypothetical protein
MMRALSGMGWVVLSHNLAAVVHSSYRMRCPISPGLPKNHKPKPSKLQRHVIGMGLRLWLFVIGVYRFVLYNVLPYAVDYHPLSHVIFGVDAAADVYRSRFWLCQVLLTSR